MQTPDEIIDPDYLVAVITPEGFYWNPHLTSYKLNEEAHIYYYGHLTQHHHRTPHLIEDTDIHLDSIHAMAAEVNVRWGFQ